MATKFPDYAALTSPAPLGVEEVQAQLGADEALVLFLDTPEAKSTLEETFIWVVTKTDMHWVRSDLGTKALGREVQALRCGLDAEAWEDRPCADLTGRSYTDADRHAGKPLPFDHARAHRLYQALFGLAEDLIKGKQLLDRAIRRAHAIAVPGASQRLRPQTAIRDRWLGLSAITR